MMNRWTALALCGGLLASATASAEDVGAVVKAIETRYADVGSIQASFVQTTKSQMYGEERQAGEVLLERPKKMFWDFQGESRRQFVTDGRTMWVYNATDNQVIRYDDISQTSSQADALLTSLDALSELFEVSLLPDTVGYTLKLKPKKDAGQIKDLQLELDAAYVVERVVLVDGFDNTTDLKFEKVTLGGDVPDSKFVFQVPAGAEVISAGGQ